VRRSVHETSLCDAGVVRWKRKQCLVMFIHFCCRKCEKKLKNKLLKRGITKGLLVSFARFALERSRVKTYTV
jgi:hypothetical protein